MSCPRYVHSWTTKFGNRVRAQTTAESRLHRSTADGAPWSQSASATNSKGASSLTYRYRNSALAGGRPDARTTSDLTSASTADTAVTIRVRPTSASARARRLRMTPSLAASRAVALRAGRSEVLATAPRKHSGLKRRPAATEPSRLLLSLARNKSLPLLCFQAGRS